LAPQVIALLVSVELVWRQPTDGDLLLLALGLLLAIYFYQCSPSWCVLGLPLRRLSLVIPYCAVALFGLIELPRSPAATVVSVVVIVVVAIATVCGARWLRRVPIRSPFLNLSNPLRTEAIICHGGPSWFLNNHARSRYQRFAVDIVCARGGRRAKGLLPSELSSYFSYGEAVFAPVSGRVLEAHNTTEDRLPGAAPSVDRADPKGNYVILRTSEGLDLTQFDGQVV
jgi:hypothetical protein